MKKTTMATRTRWHSRILRFAAGGVLACGFALGCRGEQSDASDPVGGETHFLRACEPDTAKSSCGDAFDCVCNVCTKACDSPDSCPDVPGVTCLAAATSCAPAGVTRACDVSCSSDGDCASLSGVHVCEGAVCRPGTAASPRSGSLLSCEPGSVHADEVLVLGDRLFAGPHPVGTELDVLARAAGILPTGRGFPDSSRATRNALAYDGQGITAQYLSGNPDRSVRIAIMSGGEVDAAMTCEPVSLECPGLLAAAVAAADLFQEMFYDGVQEVVYVYYPDPSDAGQKARLDALRTFMLAVCEQAFLSCYFLDLNPVFTGHGEYVDAAGLTAQGAKATADAIWDVTSGCLAP
jgi:hypothetical protein